MPREKQISILLRLGLAFAFLYPAIAAFFDPTSWIGYFPQFIKEAISNEILLLHSFGAIEVILALWILSGWKIFYSSAIAAFFLLAIVAFNWPQLDILFRDISIVAIALTLAVKSSPFRKNR